MNMNQREPTYLRYIYDGLLKGSPNKSLGSRFWKGFAPNEIGENNKLKELNVYKIEDLPVESSWKHQKLRNFIKTDKALNSLVGKKIEYLFRDDKNSNYAYCIVELYLYVI
jgi:hypothetical protein